MAALIMTAIETIQESRILQYVFSPLRHDFFRARQQSVPEPDALPHRLRVPIAVNIGPHVDVVLLDQIQDWLEPELPNVAASCCL